MVMVKSGSGQAMVRSGSVHGQDQAMVRSDQFRSGVGLHAGAARRDTVNIVVIR